MTDRELIMAVIKAFLRAGKALISLLEDILKGEEIHIYDYVDEKVPVLLRMYRKRTKTYRTIGYEIQTVLS